jgi:hypothetical protein
MEHIIEGDFSLGGSVSLEIERKLGAIASKYAGGMIMIEVVFFFVIFFA